MALMASLRCSSLAIASALDFWMKNMTKSKLANIITTTSSIKVKPFFVLVVFMILL